MGADWYESLAFYGYSVNLPAGVTYRQYIKELDALNAILPAPFIFTGLLTMFHSRMEGASNDDLDELSEGAHILIGFYVNENLEKTTADSKKLAEWVAENPILDGIEIASEARFYSGIDWWDIVIDSEEEVVEEDVSDSSGAEDEDEGDYDDGDSCASSSEDEQVRT
jgi:hypothetical protein